jgi:hypothetical protein
MMRQIALFLALLGAAQAAEPAKLRLLIFSGANNHDWKSTTPALREMYEKSGRFTKVRVHGEEKIVKANPA